MLTAIALVLASAVGALLMPTPPPAEVHPVITVQVQAAETPKREVASVPETTSTSEPEATPEPNNAYAQATEHALASYDLVDSKAQTKIRSQLLESARRVRKSLEAQTASKVDTNK